MTYTDAFRSVFASTIVLALAGSVTGANASALSSRLRVTVATTGVGIDPDGYWVDVSRTWCSSWFCTQIFEARAILPPNGTVTFSGLWDQYSVQLRGMAVNCHLASANPQFVIMSSSSAGDIAIEFNVICAPVTQLAFASVADGNAEIYVINYDGTGSTRLTENSAADLEPAWSPDCARIAFTSDRDGNAEIYVMNADGSNPVRVTDNPGSDSQPTWSPDGSKIAFTSDRDGNRQIYLMNDDGSGVVNLTNDGADDTDPAWSPDGTRIAFSSTRDGDPSYPGLYVMNADGSGVTRLTTDPSVVDIQPAWSPDGAWLAFSRFSCDDAFGCSRDIYTMKADGSSVWWFTGTGGYDEYYTPVWSSNGIAYVGSWPGIPAAYIQVERSDLYQYPDSYQWRPAIGFNPSWRR
jgi:Tol biopolymer transport system component